MKQRFFGTLVFAVIVIFAGTAAAVDVHLKDGTVIHAASYTVQGSYVIVRLENGSQVAYNVADVDLGAMNAAKKTPEGAAAPEQAKAPSNAFSGAMSAKRGKPAMKITDQDVGHVESSQPAAAAKHEKKSLKDHQEGGKVVVQGIRVEQEKDGWRISGQVVNRMNEPVMDVRVVVQALGENSKVAASAELPVAGSLGKGQSASFSHSFKVSVRPGVRVRVFWMQQEKLSPTPGAGGGGVKYPGIGGGSTVPAAAESSRPPSANVSTKPVGGGRPPALQWGGSPAYKRGGSTPRPTPRPY